MAVVRIREVEDTDDVVRDSIWALMGRRYNVKSLAPLVGINHETLRRKLNSHGARQAFTAGEVARIAHVFGVPITALFDGLGGHIRSPGEGPTKRWWSAVAPVRTEGRPGVARVAQRRLILLDQAA